MFFPRLLNDYVNAHSFEQLHVVSLSDHIEKVVALLRPVVDVRNVKVTQF
jgi:hypothetical protein